MRYCGTRGSRKRKRIMDMKRWQKCKELFRQAIQHDPEEREAFLDTACVADAELRKEMEALLAAAARSESFLELPPFARMLADAPGERLVSTRIGQYQIESIISSGGMGTVYEAIQENPRRTVAIKVIREGIATAGALRRFEYESMILARLTHPHIAQVIEAGTHHDLGEKGPGLPYFVMEHIPEARSINEYVREINLTVRERLEIFLQVCDAVHYGHQKGIIHRDLKPSNILVNASGQVKVIDFGVARITDSDLAVTTLLTDVGQLIGTLQYMSPEQCKADPADLDIRSDVYALGVVLYEVLCGELPYDVSGTAVFEATRVICENEPKRPSTTRRALKGDVETIVLKALEKEREARYQTVGELGADINRYLEGDVILAKPVGPATRIYKRIKRNPVLSAAIGAAVLILIGFLLYVVLWSYPRIVAEMNRALAAEKEAGLQREAALEAKSDAEREASKAKAINLFLERMLSSPSPGVDGREVKVVEVLDQAAGRIEGTFAEQPEIETSLRKTIGCTYASLGQYKEAEEQIQGAVLLARSVLGEEEPDTLRWQALLGQIFKMQDRLDEAEKLLRGTLEAQQRSLGEEHLDTLDTQNKYANLLARKGMLAEAEALLIKTREAFSLMLGKEHENTIDAMTSLANVYSLQGKFDEAEVLLREVVELMDRITGKTHPNMLVTMNNLAIVCRKLGKFDEAEGMYRDAVEVGTRVLGREHPNNLSVMQNLARLLRSQGRLGEAEDMLREIIEIQKRTLGEQHADTVGSMNSLAVILNMRGEYTLAEALFREVLEIQIEVLGEDHYKTLSTRNNLALALQFQEKIEEARAMHESALQGRKRVLGDQHPDTVASMNNLAQLLLLQGHNDAAGPILHEVVEIWIRTLGPDHPATLGARSNIASVLSSQNRLVEAEALHREVLELRRDKLGHEHPDTLTSLVDLAMILMNLERSLEALPLLEEGMEIVECSLPAGHPLRSRYFMRLGECLARLKRFEDAESYLLKGYEGFNTYSGEKYAKTVQTVRLLISLYESWERPEQAEAWRSKLAE
ncbi:MAG: tetratricopeptide repeat protein [Planctomycetota bacterium]|jgi:serine/threonine protein kinase/Flp pilus assembly protein TadD